MPDCNRGFVKAIPALFVTAMLGIWASGCRPETSADARDGGSAVLQTTPELLPTPTLALPGSADPLRPPTPVVLPSPTPLAGTTAESSTEAAEAPVDAAAPSVAEIRPIATVALPEGATPQELLELGRQAAAEGDQATAAAAFRAVVDAPGDLAQELIAEAHLGLAVALLAEGDGNAAATELETLIQTPGARSNARGGELVAPVNVADAAAFHLGQARAALGDHAGAVEAFRAYLQNNPDMAAYVQPFIADSYEALGDSDAVIDALLGSLDAPAQRFQVVANRLRLASLFLARENYADAVAQYDAVHALARTEATKGQMTYLAGTAELLAGNTEAGHERYRTAVADYPRAAESYQALIALVDAGVTVDEYQRGVVDYYAGAYQPAIDAFLRYIAAAPEDFRDDAHLYLAWSYEGLGDLENALAALDASAESDPARALFERGELLGRAGRPAEALAAYDQFLEADPEAEGAASVAWTAATLADDLGQDDAAERYRQLADTFPFDENAPGALFRAAELIAAAGDPQEAQALRQRLTEQYPNNVYGAEALFRLMQAAERGEAGPDMAALAAQAETLSPTNYFALRAADFAAGVAPFTADGSMTLPDDPDADRAETETWLRERLTAAGTALPQGDPGALSAELAADPQRIIGEKLWQLGLLEEAKAELETVRETYTGDALSNYQLARYFGELGLYSSSILAAATLLGQLNATAFDAPRYLGRLTYPTYYADLVLPLAERYGFDPRLQFALIRQESLFESFAQSSAVAQGLSQVIPDTGAWIAQRLAWPDFQNEDLFKPYVGLNFGAYYLSEQLKNFDGRVYAALAAYNGGPGNAARWLDASGADHDLFVDAIDFPETRHYVERIYEGFNAYRYLYGSD